MRNLASQMPPSLPGGALAPGALFSVRGLRLGNRVLLRQNGADLEAQVLRAGAEYLEARVPPGAVPGEAELVVLRDGLPSRPFKLRIAAAAAGIFAANGKGFGPAAGESASVIAATGLGNGSAPEVWVGGKRAHVLSTGPRAGRPGVVDIRFAPAADTPRGCYVPLLVRVGGLVSNVVTVPVAEPGRACVDNSMLGDNPSALLLLTRMAMRVRLVGGAPADFTDDIGAAIFSAGENSPLLVGWQQLPPLRTCTGFTGSWISDSTSGGVMDFLFQSSGSGKDAGPEITVAGPKRSGKLYPRPGGKGFYTGELGGGLPFTRYPLPRFLEDGASYRITGKGGPDFGAFAVESKFPKAIKWRNPERLDLIDRAHGAAVRWSGATAKDRIVIMVFNVDQLTGGMGLCLCVAPGESGRMDIPPMALANIPASTSIPGIPMNFVFVGVLPAGPPQRFQKNGVVVLTTLQGRTVTFR